MKYYTLIGSRSTPEEVYQLLVKIAVKLKSEGWVVRSGGADGADSAAEEACKNENMNIYLPWNNFNSRYSEERVYIVSDKLSNYSKAQQIASETHPAWDRCSRGAKSLHTRNVYQIFGSSLDKPSKFVICYAEPSGKKGHVKGGTATAVKLALNNDIKVYNLWYEETRQKMIKWLEK